MTYVNGGNKNFPWETNWLNFSTNIGNFQLTTKVTSAVNYNGWVYPLTKNKYYTMSQSNLVGDWSISKINDNTQMSISFWINISTINSNWRNIFQVSDQNINCCDVGSRSPAMWICPGTTQIYITHGTSTNGSSSPGMSSYQVPLNTNVFITIVFNSTTMVLYTNSIIQQTYTYSSTLIPALSTASFYIPCPWSSFGGLKIKNLKFYNSVFSENDVFNLYKSNMTP